jgi:hypothetical protein
LFSVRRHADRLGEGIARLHDALCRETDDRASMSETADSTPSAEAAASDRRRFRRVPVDLPGRYMLEDGSEHPCVCIDISVGGVRLRADQAGPWGSRVVAYIDGVGRIEGYIVRRAPGWFALESHITARKGERVQERIALITESSHAVTADRRGLVRESAGRQAFLTTRDGRRHVAEITDITRQGAAVLTEAQPALDERVRLESRRARVARLFPGGLALTFEAAAEEPRAPRRELAEVLGELRARRA